MSRKKEQVLVVDENGQRWDLDDFDLDSHGVETPITDRLEMLATLGQKPRMLTRRARRGT